MCLREGGVIPDHIKVVSCTVTVVGRGTAKERQERSDDSVGLYSCISRVALEYGHTNDTSDIALSDLNERGEPIPENVDSKVDARRHFGAPVRKFVGFLRHRGAAVQEKRDSWRWY